MAFKPTICLDFDGVIHRYSRGWAEGQIYDVVVPGFFQWAEKAQRDFRLVIHSSRANDLQGVSQIRTWLANQLEGWRGDPINIEVSTEKPAAFVSIDDRGVRFDGNWYAPELQPAALLDFKPWMNR